MDKDKNKNNKVSDTQKYAYQLTINNPLDCGFDHHKIKETLITHFTTLKYFCMADEIGSNGTPHTHLYIHFTSRVRFSTIKRRFEHAHIEVAFGTTVMNRDYIRKAGKWADSEKAETSIPNTFEEWGTLPVQKGRIPEMEELYNMVKDGMSNSEILAVNHDYILNIDKLDKLRTMLLIEENKNKRRLDLKVTYIYGATGTGKTRGVLDEHGDSQVYRISDYSHPFDGYECQNVMVFDEFRSNFRMTDILAYADIYPIQLPARYSNKFACYNYLYIISNWKLEEQYSEVQRESPESWKAFLRRIHEVRVYQVDGSIEIYNSVQEYLDRENKFHSCSKDEIEQLPFDFD